MREKKFTPAPWNIHKGIYETGFEDLVDDCGSHAEFFITTSNPAFQLSSGGLDRNDDESIELEANATLISSAPELLAALEKIVSDKAKGFTIGIEHCKKAETAIAKAYGEIKFTSDEANMDDCLLKQQLKQESEESAIERFTHIGDTGLHSLTITSFTESEEK